MTEAEWLACTKPQVMLDFLRGKATDRKLRLFACACCRRIWHLLIDDRCRIAVNKSELFADQLIPPLDLAFAYDAASKANDELAEIATRKSSDVKQEVQKAWDSVIQQRFQNQGIADGIPISTALLHFWSFAITDRETRTKHRKKAQRAAAALGCNPLPVFEALCAELESGEHLSIDAAVEEYRIAQSHVFGAAATTRLALLPQVDVPDNRGLASSKSSKRDSCPSVVVVKTITT